MRWRSLATLGLLAAAAKEEARAADLPLFVVERSRVIWPKKCARPATPVPAELHSQIRKEMGERGLIVGGGRADEVALGAPECMPGECGSGQFSVPLVSSETERTGLLVPAGKIDPVALRPLKLVSVEGTDPHGLRPGLPALSPAPPSCGEPPAESSPRSPAAGLLITCLTYREPGGALGVQIQGRGQLEGNGSPAYEVVRFRLLDSHTGVPGAWHAQVRGKGSRMPVPVALVPSGARSEVRVLWLRQEGICCPSAASAWWTDVGEHATDGPRRVAGFGQPCD
ncbi:MAG TPA: hypothetical protein VFN91_15850 [Myxococcaceae bacterium]|nr:hypothetical protein [Myxococcaceae bacterium]